MTRLPVLVVLLFIVARLCRPNQAQTVELRHSGGRASGANEKGGGAQDASSLIAGFYRQA
jgi:hypothetical protein